jgi:hypothetical protein
MVMITILPSVDLTEEIACLELKVERARRARPNVHRYVSRVLAELRRILTTTYGDDVL